MKKFNSTAVMMKMCMQICCMCMAFCASDSDMFSLSSAKHFAA